MLGLVVAAATFPGEEAKAQVFGPPAVLSNTVLTDSGDDIMHDVSTDGAGTWVAVWNSTDSLGGYIGTDEDILVSRSTDDGATWSAPAALSPDAGSDSGDDVRPEVETDGAGNWIAVWNSTDSLSGTIGTDEDILVSRSTDNGVTWSTPQALNTNAGSDSGVDWEPQLATDGAGNWVVVWWSEDSLGGTIGTDRDSLVSRSSDNGVTWSAPAPLNSGAASDTRHDSDPEVATDGLGNWVAVWRSNENIGGSGTDYDIMVARSSNNGATWTTNALLNSSATSDSGHDSNPVVRTDGAGGWVCVWQSQENLGGSGTDYDIFFARSGNNGASWSAVGVLNSNAATDSGDDFVPQLGTDGAGNWVAVWHSNDSFGGTIGTDYDVLVSTSADGGATWSVVAPLHSNAATDAGDDQNAQVTTDSAGN